MSKILLIDNYDSFTYNIYHYLEELWNPGVEVLRNDELSLEKTKQYERIVISPGPNLPQAAGNLMPVLKDLITEKKILGICLGMQAIAAIFDLKLKNLNQVVHGQSTPIKIIETNSLLFQGVPLQFKVGRYHSWVIDETNYQLEEHLTVTAVDESENIMAVEHPTLPIHAVQFHPESVLCEHGKDILRNWLK